MKKILGAVALLLVLVSLIIGQTKPPAAQNAVQEVTALERAWIDAERQYDVAWFEKYLADTIVSTDENGAVMDKSAMIADVKSKASNNESVTYEGLKVQVYGDAAVATGISVVKGGTYKGKDNSGKFPWTDTWVKLSGRWQCVASHNSKIVTK
jgi:ketosteroid isomerase-like protein